MKYIESWNLNKLIQQKPKFKWWVIENFINEKVHYSNGTLGIKWVNEKKGFIKEWFSSKEDIRTYVVLISWKAKIIFPDTWEEIVMSKQGDYIYFSTQYSNHTTYILEDCVMIAVRWKEIT